MADKQQFSSILGMCRSNAGSLIYTDHAGTAFNAWKGVLIQFNKQELKKGTDYPENITAEESGATGQARIIRDMS